MAEEAKKSNGPKSGNAGPGRGNAGPGRGNAGPGRGNAGPGRGNAGPGRGKGPHQGKRSGGRDNANNQDEEGPEFIEKVVKINRCAKVVKGGRRFSFSALVVAGDGKGKVGVGYGKAKEVPEAIRKGTERARANMETINIKGTTIPHQVLGEHDGGKVLFRPATDGTGVIAGGGVRAVLEAVGIHDILSKSLGSNNSGAMVYATMAGLRQLRTADQIANIKSVEAVVEA